MKQTKKWLIAAASLFVFTACEKDHDGNPGGNDDNGTHVYTISNSAKGNSLVDYLRSGNGMLKYDNSYSTGGLGTGKGLGSQGAVTIAENGTILVVNAGSNSISSFRVTRNGPVLQSTVPSGGEMPISIAEYNNAVVVLNAGGDGNISGFSLSGNGKLTAIHNSTRPLSSKSSGPAQVSFVNDGKVLVVTEKATNKIISYTTYGTMHTLTSAHPTPFGFATGRNGNIFVSEADGGAAGTSTVSSYHVDNNGVIKLVTGPVAANQTAACWVVITNNGKYVYATNTGSNTVTSFSSNANTGSLSVSDAIAASTGGTPIDAALSNNSKYLYVLATGTNNINSYKVNQDGSLTSIQVINDVAGSSAGLAAN